MTIVKKYRTVLYIQVINTFLIFLTSVFIENYRYIFLLIVLMLTNGFLQLLQTKIFRSQIITEYNSIESFKVFCISKNIRVLPDFRYCCVLGYTLFIWGIYFSNFNFSNELNYMKKYLILPIIILPIEFSLTLIAFGKLLT